MKAGVAWAIAVTIGSVCLWAPNAEAQPVELSASMALESTYVFRGLPQYLKDDTPSLQLNALGKLGHGDGQWWLGVWGATALAENKANDRFGSANEVDVSFGYAWDLHPRVRWTFGAVDYIRPSNDPINFRLEALTEVEWMAFQNAIWTLRPYASVHGEVLELLGVYAEVGLRARADLGEGFVFNAKAAGGGSEYVDAGGVFNHVETEAALVYTLPILPEVTISGHISLAVAQRDIGIGTEFFERHGVVWSGLKIGYTATPGHE